jgi:hypothetical protein
MNSSKSKLYIYLFLFRNVPTLDVQFFNTDSLLCQLSVTVFDKLRLNVIKQSPLYVMMCNSYRDLWQHSWL